MRKKILFLIHDLGPGGAEKVLVNLVNHMDRKKFDITVMTLFDVGVNRQFLNPAITYKACYAKAVPGNSKLMKVQSPEKLHKRLIKEHYDIEVSYLEGPSARIISGCTDSGTKLVCWIHSEQYSKDLLAASFRSFDEAVRCYDRFHKIIAVSGNVRHAFLAVSGCKTESAILYNTNDSDKILRLAQEPLTDGRFAADAFNIIAVGKLAKVKAYDRLIRIVRRLTDEGKAVHVYIAGEGPEREKLLSCARENGVQERFTLCGYQTNPYKYIANADLFVCSSLTEGFSTAAAEALITGTPVCTVEVPGMKEMLGENNEYGIVTENTEEALYQGIRSLIDDPDLLAHYKEKAAERGRAFRTEKTVRAVEEMFMHLSEES